MRTVCCCFESSRARFRLPMKKRFDRAAKAMRMRILAQVCQIASQVFLQTRYSFASGSLLIPECEMSLLLQASRRPLVKFVHSLGRTEASTLLAEGHLGHSPCLTLC